MAISPIFRNQPAKAAWPLLFCREIARYYHRLFSATYSLRTPPVMHMMKLRARKAIGLELCGALLVVLSARAQMPLAAAKPPDGETLLKQQCASLGPPTSRGS
jgi:hypothetical protein